MAIAGFVAPILGPKLFGLSPQDNATLSGALGGALVGAAGALLAMLVVDWRQRIAAEEALRMRLENARMLITAELVNVAMGLIASKKTMDIAVSTVTGGGTVPTSENLSREMPRTMPLTDSLAADLLILDPASIDALVTLKSNLERTGEGMLEVTSGRRQFGLFAAQQLSAALAHDMTILGECFEKIAPKRMFKLNGEAAPELASTALRRLAMADLSIMRIGL